MSHTSRDKKKLLDRVRKIRGQIDAVEKALLEEHECGPILQTIAAARGAINGLMGEMIEGHIRHHVIDPDQTLTEDQSQAVEELVDVVRTYLK